MFFPSVRSIYVNQWGCNYHRIKACCTILIQGRKFQYLAYHHEFLCKYKWFDQFLFMKLLPMFFITPARFIFMLRTLIKFLNLLLVTKFFEKKIIFFRIWLWHVKPWPWALNGKRHNLFGPMYFLFIIILEMFCVAKFSWGNNKS